MKLPLTRHLLSQPPASSLPLPLTRKLGEQAHDAEQVPNHHRPSKPKPPPKNPFGRLVGGGVDVCVAVAGNVGICGNWTHDGKLVGQNQAVARQPVTAVADCLYLSRLPFAPIANVSQTTVQRGLLLTRCHRAAIEHFKALANCTTISISPTVGYQVCTDIKSDKVIKLTNCTVPTLDPVVSHQDCSSHDAKGVLIDHCHDSHIQHATSVPCRYYPIPKPPLLPAVFACRLRPPASGLPLTLTRRKGLPASALPLPLMCWHDTAPAFVPNLRSYLVHHIVTATLGGLNIDPIKFDIKTDMDSYCYSGSIEISHVDYQRIKAKLDVERGNEPLILVNVNGKAFGFIAENVSRNRQFGASVYQLSGRSSTARLGQDYAQAQGVNGTGGTIEQDLYASQIMRMQLNDLPFSIDEFDVDDWLIPAGTLNVSNQTPISIISQLATACGGKVISHISEPKLSIIKRWRVPAWEMATAKPSLVVPMNVVHSISDEKRTHPRHNTITLIGRQEAFEIYRQGQGRDLIAPVANWYLYTDQASAIARGVQLLSDSGNHVHYTVKMLVSDKHNLPLAKLGQIWQINDDTDGGDGAFNALITSVALSVSRDNDAVVVWQTVGMDRYVDV